MLDPKVRRRRMQLLGSAMLAILAFGVVAGASVYVAKRGGFGKSKSDSSSAPNNVDVSKIPEVDDGAGELSPEITTDAIDTDSLQAAGTYPASPVDQTELQVAAWGPDDYATVLGLNFKFFEANWAGPLPEDYRISWRNDAYVGVCGGLDGGNFEGGNHIQALIATANQVYNLAMGGMYWKQGFEKTSFEGQTNQEWLARELRRQATWMERAVTVAPGSSLIAVHAGNNKEFAFYGRAEDAPTPECYFTNPERPAADHVGHAAAALAMAAMYFNAEPEFSQSLITASKNALAQSMASNTTSSTSGFKVGELYKPFENDKPAQHQFLAACTLYQATFDPGFMDMALQLRRLSEERSNWQVSNWDNPYWAGMMCLAQSAPIPSVREAAIKSLDAMLRFWVNEKPPIKYNSGGLATVPIMDGNPGTLRDVSNAALIALQFAELEGVVASVTQVFRCFAQQQLNYILGHNPLSESYLVGYTSDVAKTFPRQPHHRDAACKIGSVCTRVTFNDVTQANPYTLQGGLVSGPSLDGLFRDQRNVYVETECALDFNAGFTAAIAGIASLPPSFYINLCT